MPEIRSLVTPISLGQVSVFVLKGTKLILIDTGFSGTEDLLCQKMIQKGLDPKDLALIVLTHGHDDHFGGAGGLKERTGAPVAIHSCDADHLRKGINGKLQPTRRLGRLLTALENREPLGMGLEPDILLDEEFSLAAYGVPGKVIATPGHTPGSVSVILESREVIVGDLMMGFFPKTRPELPLFADDVAQVEESIRRIMHDEPRKIFASHGGPFEPEAVRERFGVK
ncbi:hypothetical protein DCMF_21765 [Candidatus Formimonas warabiya]|uniref:Metallo-beta-lactamase domain-containing protein n=2 Tax=Formimonas warabiya TaxID=1761012 RepID=A0A3G1KX50_FORW1|nr:hypothetical protein DCMF_21765 [Candidatus Formimonas warabiya]